MLNNSPASSVLLRFARIRVLQKMLLQKEVQIQARTSVSFLRAKQNIKLGSGFRLLKSKDPIWQDFLHRKRLQYYNFLANMGNVVEDEIFFNFVLILVSTNEVGSVFVYQMGCILFVPLLPSSGDIT
jgi:hypothetical protein